VTGAALGDGAREHLLAFADDEHLMGQQHAEWIGVAPFLEEDLAFCSIAQDELGHAATLYELLTDDVDALAFGRRPEEYRSCHLVEVPCPDWADALARHWLYDLAEELRWEALAESSVGTVADAVERAQREETYHRRHADALIRRMLDDPDSGPRVSDAIRRLLPLADALWEPVAGEDEALAAGVVTARSVAMRDAWRSRVVEVAGPVDWAALEQPDQRGRTKRSDHFDALHSRINEVLALDPTAQW
jgi:ring-1,2-phenylacetyl-CoA epoxidase subunit PaaC